ncbi:hypothetical protein C8A00DRAFT_38939, partial [Chaetomidium leptoderma]
MRYRCLMLILIGNLDLALELESLPHQTMTTLVQRQNLASSNSHSPRPGTTTSEAPAIRRRPTAQMSASAWRHMEVLLNDLRLYAG